MIFCLVDHNVFKRYGRLKSLPYVHSVIVSPFMHTFYRKKKEKDTNKFWAKNIPRLSIILISFFLLATKSNTFGLILQDILKSTVRFIIWIRVSIWAACNCTYAIRTQIREGGWANSKSYVKYDQKCSSLDCVLFLSNIDTCRSLVPEV